MFICQLISLLIYYESLSPFDLFILKLWYKFIILILYGSFEIYFIISLKKITLIISSFISYDFFKVKSPIKAKYLLMSDPYITLLTDKILDGVIHLQRIQLKQVERRSLDFQHHFLCLVLNLKGKYYIYHLRSSHVPRDPLYESEALDKTGSLKI